MSASNWTTIWRVRVEEGSWSDVRTAEVLFTNERAARAFEKLCWKRLPNKRLDVSVEEIEAAKTLGAGVHDAAYPFSEFRAVPVNQKTGAGE